MKFLWWGRTSNHHPPEEAVRLKVEVDSAKSQAIASDVEVTSLIDELKEIRKKNNIRKAILNCKVQGRET